jgi:hypothetical protein
VQTSLEESETETTKDARRKLPSRFHLRFEEDIRGE